MPIDVRRDPSGPLRHHVHVRAHTFVTDVDAALGGEDSGPDPHDLYDASVASCKALTVMWYARRKSLPVEDVHVHVERDASEERKGLYRLTATLTLTGPLTEAQRQELLTVADKCPVHKLMTQVTTEIQTLLGDPATRSG